MTRQLDDRTGAFFHTEVDVAAVGSRLRVMRRPAGATSTAFGDAR